jgi:hypothetical protein
VASVTGGYTVLAAAALRNAYTMSVDGKTVLQQKRSGDQSPNSTELPLDAGDPVKVQVEYLPDADVGEHSPVVLRPVRELKSFSKVRLQPHTTKYVSVTLRYRAFAHFDTGAHEWKTDARQYMIEVGTSAEQIALSVPVTLH